MQPAPIGAEPLVEFRGVAKSYDGRAQVVADLDLAVRRGEFLTLLGPSGSGKTTTLMMLAGFETPDHGDIVFEGSSLLRVPPHRRNMGVVFQNYALFPHMSVARNLAFPLEVRGMPAGDTAARVARALDLVNLDGLADRRVNQLSGGQQQRVEALALSDRIAVFAHGKVQQLGTPQAIYERPANAFVAGFVGDNNCLPARVTDRDAGFCTVRIGGDLAVRARAVGTLAPGDAALLAVRPEAMVIDGDAALANRFDAEIEECVFHGDHSNVRIRLPGGTIVTARADGPQRTGPVSLGWSAEAAGAFAASDGRPDPAVEQLS